MDWLDRARCETRARAAAWITKSAGWGNLPVGGFRRVSPLVAGSV